MTRTIHHLAAALALGAAATGQALTISDGNMRFTTGVLSATATTPRTLDLRGDALSTDHGFEHWWYFRIAGDTRETSLRSVGTVTGGVAPFLSHLDRDFADLENRGLLRAYHDADVYDSGPASGVVVSRLTLRNLSAAAVTFDLFCYNDLDIAGTSGNDVVTGNGSSHVVTDLTGVRVEIRAIGNDKSDVATYPNIRNLLTNAAVDDLTDALPPFLGDYTGAFQWQNRTLQPGEQRTFSVVFAIDTAANSVPFVEHYGIGSSNAPEIFTDTLPLQDNSQVRQVGIHLRGAPPNAPVGLLSNVTAAPGIPFAGLSLWVDPTGGMQFPITNANGSGESLYIFSIPVSPYLTGYPLYHQYFFVDSTAPNGSSGSTPAILTRLGRL